VSPFADRLAPVAQRIARVRSAIRRLFALDGTSRLFIALAAFVLVTLPLDWALVLPAGVRLFLLAAGLGLFGWIVLRRIAYPLGVKISDDDVALFVERQYPELNDRLISAIQLSRAPVAVPEGDAARREVAYNSPELVEAVIADAAGASADLEFDSVLVRRHVQRVASWAAAAVLVLVVGAMLSPVYAGIYVNRIFGGSAKWPQRTHLRVLDFEGFRRVMPRGDDLPIAVAFDGVDPGKVLLEYAFKTGERGRERLSPVETTLPDGTKAKHYQFTFTRVTGPFDFRVEGGDDRYGPLYSVETLTPPSLETVQVFHEYPAYLRKAPTPPERPEPSGNVVAPLHTKVRFEAFANEELKAAAMVLGLKGKEKRVELGVAASPDGRSRRFSGGFTVNELYSEYVLEMTAVNGLGNRDPIRFTIKGLEDRPPQIFVRDPAGDEYVTELCERPIEIEVKDDHGVARISRETAVRAQKKEKARDWAALEYTREHNSRDYGEPAIRCEDVLSIAALGLEPGDHVDLRFRAEDYKDIEPRNLVVSARTYKLSVVPIGTLEKELQEAIEKIKQILRSQKTRQENAWTRTGRLIEVYGRSDALTQEQQGEIRQAGLEQNDVTSRLDTARRDILQIKRRGVYNKIFNESAAEKLQGAVDELALLVGEPGDVSKPGISRGATAQLDQSARVKTGAARTDLLREAQNLQSLVASGIQRAIDFLEKWSSYQEVIRAARELHDRQKGVIDDLRSPKK
jgi:hypothetical protein